MQTFVLAVKAEGQVEGEVPNVAVASLSEGYCNQLRAFCKLARTVSGSMGGRDAEIVIADAGVTFVLSPRASGIKDEEIASALDDMGNVMADFPDVAPRVIAGPLLADSADGDPLSGARLNVLLRRVHCDPEGIYFTGTDEYGEWTVETSRIALDLLQTRSLDHLFSGEVTSPGRRALPRR